MILHLKRDIKDLKRLEYILQVFLEEGLGYYIKRAKLRSHLPFSHQVAPVSPISNQKEQAKCLRQAFERLGPTFIKLGQLLSLRPDLVPEVYTEELAKLQDHVPSFPFDEAKRIIKEELKEPIKNVFSKIDKKPLASASIAQVHKAKLKSGKEVVIKVQRPNIKEIIDTDLDLLFFIAQSLEKHIPSMKNYQPLDVVKEFSLWTRKELDFRIEGYSAQRLKEELKDNKKVYIPKTYHKYNSRRMLVLEFVEGIKLSDLKLLKKMQLSRKKLAMAYFTSILEQALIHGFFHADPHPANIFVRKNGQLIYLDYGIMGELSSRDCTKIIRFITSIPDKDSEKSLNIIISLARLIPESHVDLFKQETLPILEEVYFNDVETVSIGKAMYKIISLGAQYGIIFNPNHILMAKAIYQAEGLGLKLDPKLKVAAGLEEFSSIYLKANLTPKKLLMKARKKLHRERDLLLELPEHLRKIVERLEQPPPPLLSPNQLAQLEQRLEHIEHNRNTGFLAITVFIAAIILLYNEGQVQLFGISLSTALFVVATLLTIYMVIHH